MSRRGRAARDSSLGPAGALRRTRLVATIGPASAARVGELVAVGLDVARINLSHGTPSEHLAWARSIREASAAAGRDVAIMVDLPGAKLRLGSLPGGAVELHEASILELVGAVSDSEEGSAAGSPRTLPIDDASVLPRLRRGDRVLLADGAVELAVLGGSRGAVGMASGPSFGGGRRGSVGEAGGRRDAVGVAGGRRGAVRVQVVRGGSVRSRAGVNVPAERLPEGVPDVSDQALLAHVRELAPDFVAQSFVRSASDVEILRPCLPDTARLVAKIETRPGVEAVTSILRVADAIMVARGDLGVELPWQEVPLVQKDLVLAAMRAGRPSIVATQMLESMVTSPTPTRAEASDVANAVLDGADAVMLSAETAIGAWPTEALRAAGAICALADSREARAWSRPNVQAADVDAAAVTMAAADRDVVALACFTRTGRTARLLAALRPPVPVMVLTSDPAVSRSLALLRGVRHVVPGPLAEVGWPSSASSEAPDLGTLAPASPAVPEGWWAGVGEAVGAALRRGVAGWTWPQGGTVVLVTAGSRQGGPDRLEVLRVS